ncbi:LpqN/LpqT family lipoprotein [Mycolicibacterium nivoides]|uniref:LpqN/LpqT family lipoprotein n=1 Tax=Mycolicibacterium nivoides TaxID=2487344 RepID=UPI003C2B4A91
MTGPHKAINDYITENKIAETPFKPNDPGPPDFDFPFPPDRSSPGAGHGAIVYDKPADPADPPAIIAIARRTPEQQSGRFGQHALSARAFGPVSRRSAEQADSVPGSALQTTYPPAGPAPRSGPKGTWP